MGDRRHHVVPRGVGAVQPSCGRGDRGNAARHSVVLPAVVDIATSLVPTAAVGLGLLMMGAGAVHVRRGEGPNVAVNAVLPAVAAVVAWGRFGPYAF
ncbi:DoxX family protein [Streptomyces sp. 205]|uniref:DoxX family protein n=2 Tax=Streptomyces coffeae TaxID=621382 RepID=A0ABS1NAU5_9ACTN|nr:DoxX family protein [Streptomyces coffeae]